jgi:peptidyl-prolyl cis-trans isomerase C
MLKPQLKRIVAQDKMIKYIDSLKSSAQIKIMLPEEKPKAPETTEKKEPKAAK